MQPNRCITQISESSFFIMNALDIKTLPLGSKFGICWSFFWRGILITLASALCAGLMGAATGFLWMILGLPKSALSTLGAAMGLACGLMFFYVYVRWLLSTRLGRFKLLLVTTHD